MSANPSDPLVALLAGGGSRRFGRPKETAELQGRPMVEYPVAAARRAGLPLVLVGGDAALAERLDVRHLSDAPGVPGPIGGLLSALRWAVHRRRPGVVLLGVDMPLYPAGLLSLVAREAKDDGSTAVALRTPDGRLQTLGAFYPTARLDDIATVATGPEPSLRRAYAASDGRGLDGSLASLKPFDLDLAFRNVNTPEDLAEVAALLR